MFREVVSGDKSISQTQLLQALLKIFIHIPINYYKWR